MSLLYLLLGGGGEGAGRWLSAIVLRRRAGVDPRDRPRRRVPDVLVEGVDRRGRHGGPGRGRGDHRRRTGCVLAPGPRRPAHAPARAGLRGTRRPSRPGRGPRRPAGTRRSRRWPTRIPSPTTPASSPRSARRLPRPGSCDVFPVGAITKGLGGESLAEMGEMVDAGRAGVQRRRPLRARPRVSCATRSRTRRRSPRRSSWPTTARTPPSSKDGQMHEGAQLVHARSGRTPGRGRGGRRGARHRPGAADGRPAARLPRARAPVGGG